MARNFFSWLARVSESDERWDGGDVQYTLADFLKLRDEFRVGVVALGTNHGERIPSLLPAVLGG